MRAERSAGSSLAKTTPLMAKNSEISTVRPMRMTKLEWPVTVQSAALPLKWRTSALTISLNQSISQKARPASTALQLARCASTA